MNAAEWAWFGTGIGPRVARMVLRPLSLPYAAAVALRGALYDRGALASEAPALPALSVGNLSVGGTGKTPVAAWAASRLEARGARPAIVLRGYGDDEPLVHARLNPDIPVIVSPVRAEGIRRAREQGRDVVVLDDAFQHRRIGRTVDWVLVSADRWTNGTPLLPAGPWREPLSALGRASVVIVTRKAAPLSRAREVRDTIARALPRLPAAILALELDALRSMDDARTLPLEALAGAQVLLIAGIGDPAALRRQFEQRGAQVRERAFPDHHVFTTSEITDTVRSARADEVVVCTLKDAVKLAGLWPRAAPGLWYVSQRVNVEEGVDSLNGSFDVLLRARSALSDAVRPRGPHL